MKLYKIAYEDYQNNTYCLPGLYASKAKAEGMADYFTIKDNQSLPIKFYAFEVEEEEVKEELYG